MKKKISLWLLLILLIAAATLVLSSCLDQFQLPGMNPPDGDEEENGGGNEDTPPEVVSYKARFYYKNGINKESVIQYTLKSDTGFTPEIKEEIENLLHNGYGFVGYYADEALVTPFDFDAPLTSDVSIYCKRNIKEAGRNIEWNVYTETEGSEVNTVLEFRFKDGHSTGAMYEFTRKNDVPWSDKSRVINKVIIPEGVTTIAAHAFNSFTKIDTVELPTTTVRIGNNCFYESSITDIKFTENITHIGEYAFSGCEGLVHLNFNHGLQFIERGAFDSCENLETVVLTDTIMQFGGSAFNECTSLYSAYYIGTEEQYNQIDVKIQNFWVKQLANTYFISEERPATHGPYWYYGDDNEIKQWYYTVWYMSSGTAKTPFTKDFIDAESGIAKRNIDFMNGIQYNGYKFAFWTKNGSVYTMSEGSLVTNDFKIVGNRGNLCGDNLKWSISGTGELVISRINTGLSDGAMWDFKETGDAPWKGGRPFSKVVISDGVTHIGSYAFYGIFDTVSRYSRFSYIDIPISVTSVSEKAFGASIDLLYIFYAGEDASGVTGLNSLQDTSAVVYENATGKNYSTLDYTTEGKGAYWANVTGASETARIAWSYKDGTLEVGAADKYHTIIDFTELSETPWYTLKTTTTKIVIKDNVKEIGENAFAGMENASQIFAPTGLLFVGDGAFSGTEYYDSMLEGEGCVYLYNYTSKPNELVYYHLIKVNSTNPIFIFKDKTLTVAANAFEGCSAITKLVINKDLKYQGINNTSFAGLSALEEIYYEGNKTSWSHFTNDKFAEIEGKDGVYFLSAIKPTDTGKYWKWNDDKTEPIVWEED